MDGLVLPGFARQAVNAHGRTPLALATASTKRCPPECPSTAPKLPEHPIKVAYFWWYFCLVPLLPVYYHLRLTTSPVSGWRAASVRPHTTNLSGTLTLPVGYPKNLSFTCAPVQKMPFFF